MNYLFTLVYSRKLNLFRGDIVRNPAPTRNRDNNIGNTVINVI